MIQHASSPAIHWLFIALGVVCVLFTAIFLIVGLTVEIFLTALGLGLALTVGGFMLLRLILRVSNMPSGWADPVIDSSKARKAAGLRKAREEALCDEPIPERPDDVDYLSDTGSLKEEDLASEFLQMGRLLLKSGRYSEAKSTFEKAHVQDQANSKIFNYIGISCGRLNQFEEAVDAYNKAIALDYDYASAHFNLASVYDQMGDNLNAMTQWQRYLEVGKVLGERKDMLDRARDRLACLKKGTDKMKKNKLQPPAESEEKLSD